MHPNVCAQKNMCLNPKWIYKKGKYKKDNYNGLEGDTYEIGTYSKCGYCEQCINEKCNNWVVRCTYEARRWKKIAFITLTYADNPIIINIEDIQKFWKRLRINLKRKGYGEKIKFFAALEYGTLNNRPHAHAIIYNWSDENAKYLDVNKKGNTVYMSEIIEKTWGLGRTSYQEFNQHEIPYIAIYSTPAQEFSRAYKLNAKKIKEIENLYKANIKDSKRCKELLKILSEYKKELKKSKKDFLAIKERNMWSQGLGWETFSEEYYNSDNYVFEAYIEDKVFAIPSPWVKKLANEGNMPAIEEMKRREELIAQSANEKEEATKNLLKVIERRKKERIDWIKQKDKIELL